MKRACCGVHLVCHPSPRAYLRNWKSLTGGGKEGGTGLSGDARRKEGMLLSRYILV